MCSLLFLGFVALAAAGPLRQRQDDDVSVVGWSTVDVDSAHTLFTTTTTSTQTIDTTVTIHTEPWESVFPVTVIVSGSITQVHEETITFFPAVTPTSESTDVADEAPSSGKRDGAIAGGVVGAVLVAAIAVIVYIRFKSKRSPSHWRNRGDIGRWQNLDGKGATSGSANSGQSIDRKTPPSPVLATVPSPTSAAPLFVREKHRRSSSNPFEERSMPPFSGSSNGSQSPHTPTYIEMKRTSK